MAWLPAEEHAKWPAHWPDLADIDLVKDEEHGGSVTHAVYCHRIKRRLQALRESGAARLLIAPLRADGLRTWVADHEPDEQDPA